MTCKNCGKRLRKKDTFCPHCGTAVSATGEKTKSPKKKILLAVIAAVLVLALMGTAGYFLWPALVPQSGPFTVRFDCNASSEETDREPAQQTVAKGETASRPPFPTREGYLFSGWYLDAACTNAYDFSSAVTKDLVLYASWTDLDSQEAQLTSQQIQDFTHCTQALEDSLADYVDEEGYVDRSEFPAALDALEEVAKQWTEQGAVAYYERNDSNLYLEFSSCLTYVQSLPEKDRWSSNPLDSQLIFPFMEEEPEVYYPINNAIVNFYDDDVTIKKDADVTLQALANMEAADLFIWSGHGQIAGVLGNFLQIKEPFPTLADVMPLYNGERDSSKQELLNYYQWCLNLCREKYITTCNGTYAILGKFIETYFPPMDGSMVILNACYSCNMDNLANAFHHLGAQVVQGYDGAVYEYYSTQITYAVLYYMTTENEEGRYDTLQEALAKAKAVFGEKDNKYSQINTDASLPDENRYTDVFNKILAQGSISGYLYGNQVSDETVAVLKRNDDYQWDSKDSCEYTLWSGLTGSLVVTDSEGNPVEQNGQSLTLALTDETGSSVWTDSSTGGSFAVNRLEDSEQHSYTLTISLNETVLKTVDSISIPAHRYLDLGEIEVELSTVYEKEELYASQVVQFTPGSPWTKVEEAQNPSNALGAPDHKNDLNGLTLGGGGTLIVSFEEEFTDIDGTDLTIYEAGEEKESVEVAVSADGETWYTVGTTGGGTSRVDLNGKVPEGMYFRYVRVIDQKSSPTGTWPGADIDAIGVNLLRPVLETQSG